MDTSALSAAIAGQPAATTQPAPAAPPAPAVDPAIVATILHDIFVIGLAAAAFFIKSPATAARAGQVVNILQGLQLGPTGN